MKKLVVVVGVFLLSFGLVATSQAAIVLSTDGFAGNSKLYGDGTTVTSTNGNFSTKSIAGVTGLGVGGGSVDAEIDAYGVGGKEAITVTFPTPVQLDYLSVAFLYPNGEYSDTVNESAFIIFDGNQYILTATGFTTATWTGSGVVSNLSIAEDTSPGPGGAAVWKITSPYAGFVTKVEFLADNYVNPTNASNSDYALVAVAPVPEPGTMMLLGSGLVGLAGWGRKKFRK